MFPIRVGIVTSAFFYTPYWAALQHGWYAERGLDVEILNLGGIDRITREQKAGSVEIGVGSPEHVIHDVEQGGELRMIGGNVNRLTHSLIVQPGINSLADLRGKKIGVASRTAGTSSLFMGVLEDLGLHYPGDYEVVEAGAVPPRHELLLKGGIDAGMQTDPHNYMAEDAGLNNLGPLSQWIPEFQFTSINVRKSWAEAHPAETTAFLEATLEGSRFMVEQREAAINVAQAHMPIERRYLEKAWHDHSTGAVSLDLSLSDAGLRTAMALIRRDRNQSFRIADDAEPAKYVVDSYLRAAQRARNLPERVFE
ncbi:MAG: ABC transporter substrate-binding protein [Pseudomonadota bacterium]